MSFSLNPISIVKQEVLKADNNHNGVPDAIEILEAGEKGFEHAAQIVSIFDAEDMAAILAMLPTSVKQKVNAKIPGGLDGLAASIAAIPPALNTAAKVLATAEAKLKS